MTAGADNSRFERGRWPHFANGRPYPFICWGSSFRGPAGRLLEELHPEGVSIIATGQKSRGEIALLSFGVKKPVDELAGIVEGMKDRLAQKDKGANYPNWRGNFDESFEALKTGSRREDTGLLVITHGQNGNGTEMAAFGEIAGDDLSVIGHGLLLQEGIELPLSA